MPTSVPSRSILRLANTVQILLGRLEGYSGSLLDRAHSRKLDGAFHLNKRHLCSAARLQVHTLRPDRNRFLACGYVIFLGCFNFNPFKADFFCPLLVVESTTVESLRILFGTVAAIKCPKWDSRPSEMRVSHLASCRRFGYLYPPFSLRLTCKSLAHLRMYGTYCFSPEVFQKALQIVGH